MMKTLRLFFCGLAVSLLVSGCVASDALRLIYGNKFASHNWEGSNTTTTLQAQRLNTHTIIPVSINGQPDLRFILDTGAMATVIFETERTRGLLSELDEALDVGGIGSPKNTEARFLHDTNITLGDVTISGLTTVFISAENNPIFHSADVTYADGVLGYDVFTRFVTEIDNTYNTVTLSEALNRATAGYQELPIAIESNLPYIDIEISGMNNSVTLPAMLDTGGLGSLSIGKGHNVPDGEFLYQSQISGMGGSSDITVNRFNALKLGNYTISDVIAGVSQEVSTEKGKNILGTEVLNRFDMIINYQAERVFLKPNMTFSKPDINNVFGAWMLPHTQGAYIKQVRKDSAAFHQNIKEGVVITTVNGNAVDTAHYDVLTETLARFEAVTSFCYLDDDVTHCEPATKLSRQSAL
ncbi:aspartyl protease family protein [Alteromonas sp. A081]|uniref:aspartyl protease family protein n=1 Tax=Alteromonas sp. A081 TaxID=3410269 RepID=UPI003B984013